MMKASSRHSEVASPHVAETHALACVLCLIPFLLLALAGCEDAAAPDLTNARTITDLTVKQFNFNEDAVESFQVDLRGIHQNPNQNFNEIDIVAQLDVAPDIPLLDIDLSARRNLDLDPELKRPGVAEQWAQNSLLLRCKQIPCDGSPVRLTADPGVADDRALGLEFGQVEPTNEMFVFPAAVTPAEEYELTVNYNADTRELLIELIGTTLQIFPPPASIPLITEMTISIVVPAAEE